MAITLQYGANPTVAAMVAYQGGKNVYRNKQEEQYQRMYMQQQQLAQQRDLAVFHQNAQYGMALQNQQFQQGEHDWQAQAQQGVAGFRAQAVDIANRNRQIEENRRQGVGNAAQLERLRIAEEGRDRRAKPPEPKLNIFGLPVIPKPGVPPAAGGAPAPGAQPAAPGASLENWKGLPEVPKLPERPKLAPGMGGYLPPGVQQPQLSRKQLRQKRSWETQSYLRQIEDQGGGEQGRIYQRQIGYGQDLPNGATYDPPTGGYRAPRRKDW